MQLGGAFVNCSTMMWHLTAAGPGPELCPTDHSCSPPTAGAMGSTGREESQTDCWALVRPLNLKAVLPNHCSTQTTHLIALILMFATDFLLLRLCLWTHPFPKPEFPSFHTSFASVKLSTIWKSNKLKKTPTKQNRKPNISGDLSK